MKVTRATYGVDGSDKRAVERMLLSSAGVEGPSDVAVREQLGKDGRPRRRPPTRYAVVVEDGRIVRAEQTREGNGDVVLGLRRSRPRCGPRREVSGQAT